MDSTSIVLAEVESLRQENAMLRAALNLAAADAMAVKAAVPNSAPTSQGGETSKAPNPPQQEELNPEALSLAKVAPFLLGGSSKAAPCARHFGVGNLHRDEVERYSRQALLPHFGSQGCRDLMGSSVLVVGAGGLGSTIIPYLAAAGVGHLRIVDFDSVERSNLHRQIIHADDRCGIPKALSAEMTAEGLNPSVRIETIIERFDVSNAERLLEGIDVVLDATDNVASRYLINDACVYGNKPLVSGGATRWEGQLTVYNFNNPAVDLGAASGPCYRCLFPEPTPPSMVGNCNDVGVVGPVPGMIGCLQALEAIKILLILGEYNLLQSSKKASSRHSSNQSRPSGIEVMSGKMLMFDGLRGGYRTIKLRPKQASCRVCGDGRQFASVEEAFCSGEFPEYVPASCSIAPPFDSAVVDPAACYLSAKIMTLETPSGSAMSTDEAIAAARSAVRHRMKETSVLDLSLALPSVSQLADMQHQTATNSAVDDADRAAPGKLALKPLPVLLLDVRAQEQYNLCGIPGSLFIPLAEIESSPRDALAKINAAILNRRKERLALEEIRADSAATSEDVYVLCRRGINSMKAVRLLASHLAEVDVGVSSENPAPAIRAFVNVEGGLGRWSAEVDENFPLY